MALRMVTFMMNLMIPVLGMKGSTSILTVLWKNGATLLRRRVRL